ncbi:MAG: hypothetical protein GVY07_13890 [Bacteroidetes bacterium]|jgi:hypothetical protein|nr:hypothetical protein [Bacteroidota bacterium]
MKSEVRQIKIRLDVPQEVIEYFQLEQKWENEGGAIPRNEKAEIEHDIKAPLKPGMCYYVMDGHFEVQDKQLLYVADIHPDYNG